MLKLRLRLHDQVRRLSVDTSGMVAVEFVLTVPLIHAVSPCVAILIARRRSAWPSIPA